ncbi:hypothetical protein AU467_34255 [Mesorhizobium loti]|uniref:Uncharacterized protein n=1 Tax=Rhizobium loti TaxID=381 RepID=A0A101KLT2_RHILI|nr:hypothetical protein AU467_34255 [Mesorhizobium loti]
MGGLLIGELVNGRRGTCIQRKTSGATATIAPIDVVGERLGNRRNERTDLRLKAAMSNGSTRSDQAQCHYPAAAHS